jgi:hypothetical protein
MIHKFGFLIYVENFIKKLNQTTINDEIESLSSLFLHILHTYDSFIVRVTNNVVPFFDDVLEDDTLFSHHFEKGIALETHFNQLMLTEFLTPYSSSVPRSAMDIYKLPFDFPHYQSDGNRIPFIEQFKQKIHPFEEYPDDAPFELNPNNFRLLPPREQSLVLFQSLPQKINDPTPYQSRLLSRYLG